MLWVVSVYMQVVSLRHRVYKMMPVVGPDGACDMEPAYNARTFAVRAEKLQQGRVVSPPWM